MVATPPAFQDPSSPEEGNSVSQFLYLITIKYPYGLCREVYVE